MSLFKDTFPKEIKEQIEKRQDLLVRRNPKDLSYLNSRKAWVRLSSGVDVFTQEVGEGVLEYDNGTLAKQYVLQGGTLNDGTLRAGIGSHSSSSYSTTTPSGKKHDLGIRPMPGITNVDIKSKSAYGSLREATINFVCWDIKQLEDLEMLYMRPGFTALLEWGWSPYIKNDDTYNTRVSTYDAFLNGPIPKGDNVLQDIYKYLHVTKSLQESNGNYDALIGYIKNFQWSFRSDGGYNCNTTLISFGEVLESLKINYGVANIYSSKDSLVLKGGVVSKEYVEGISKAYSKNVLSGILYEVCANIRSNMNVPISIVGGPISSGDPTLKGGGSDSIGARIPLKIDNIEYDTFVLPLEVDKQNQSTQKDTSALPDASKYQYYITLESLCKLFNKYIIVTTDKGGITGLSTLDRDYPIKSLNPSSLLCLTHPLQLSVDPSVCLINSPVWRNGFRFPKQNENITEETPEAVNPNSGNRLYKEQAKQIVQEIIDYGIDVVGGVKGASSILEDKAEVESRSIQIGNNIDSYFALKNRIKALEQLIIEYELKRGKKTLTSSFDNIDASSSIKTTKGTPQASKGTQISIFGIFSGLSRGPRGYLSFGDFMKQSNIKFTTLISYTNASQSEQQSMSTLLNDASFTNISETGEKIEEYNKKSDELSEGLKVKLKYLNSLSLFFKDDNQDSGLGNISNIYVNIEYLYNLSLNQNLESLDKKEKNEINIYDYLKTMIGDIQSSIGNVNNFDIHVDPIDNIGRIIDINFTTEDPVKTYDEATVIEIQGTKTTATNVSLQSQIFPEQSSIVAISAQNGGGTLGLDNNTLVGFNRGIKDRILPDKYVPGIKFPLNSSEQIFNLAEAIGRLVTFITDTRTILTIDTGVSIYNISNSAEYKGALRDIINFIKAVSVDPNQFKSIIPTRLSITLDGLGGMVIGNLFRIPDRTLPSGYKGEKGIGRKVGYIVTGIGHKIDNSFWETTIDAQTVILEANEPKEKFDYGKVVIPDPLNPGGFTVEVPTSTNRVGSEPYDGSPVAVYLRGRGYYNGTIEKYTPVVLRHLQTADHKSNQYSLYLTAASQWEKLYTAALQAGYTINNFSVSDGYRNLAEQTLAKTAKRKAAAAAGFSAHGWGGAVDVLQLALLAGNSKDLKINANIRNTSALYKWLAQNGPTYGWYNPYRLADGAGEVDECWHWEYWGQI